MITKRFTHKSEIKKFENQFVNGDIDTDVIFNIVHDENKIVRHQSLHQYHRLWNSYDLTHSGLSQVLQSILTRYSSAALQHYFGIHDFVLKGNIDHYNYILESNGITFIVSDKTEVVVFKDKDFINKVIEFDNQYKQLVLDYIFENIDKISIHQKEMLDEIEKTGLIKNGKINFTYS